MWKAAAGTQINIKDTETPDDDWDTDPDFINDVTEQEQRWGARTVEGSGRNAGAIDMAKLRKETEEGDALRKKKEMEEGPKAAFGYGGKFGVQADRMDRSAVGHDYIAKVEKHASQKDYSTGFGGKFGVQTDRVDKSAVNWDHKETVEKHPSQKDYSTGFGGKFGVQADRQDQSAVGWDHVEQMHKHESQKDYSVGFGGKFGVQSDRQDKCAVGWDHHEAPQKHESQTDHKIGFGGKFGVQTDRMDKSASSFNDEPERVGTVYTKTRPDIGGAKPSALRAKFEKLSEDSQTQVTEAPKPTTGKLNQAKTAVFTQPKQEEFKKTAVETAPKQLDQSKKDLFTKQQPQTVTEPVENAPKPLDQFRMKAFLEPKQETETQIGNHVPKKIDPPETVPVPMPSSEPVIVSASSKQPETKAVEVSPPVTEVPPVPEQQPQAPVEEVAAAAEYVDQEETEITLEDTGLTAIALYDYQAAADDEISFDPDDIITHVEMIDEGWWRGLCRNQYGLFPANYVQLQQ